MIQKLYKKAKSIDKMSTFPARHQLMNPKKIYILKLDVCHAFRNYLLLSYSLEIEFALVLDHQFDVEGFNSLFKMGNNTT